MQVWHAGPDQAVDGWVDGWMAATTQRTTTTPIAVLYMEDSYSLESKKSHKRNRIHRVRKCHQHRSRSEDSPRRSPSMTSVHRLQRHHRDVW